MDGKIANAANNDVYWDMVKSWAAGNVNAKIPSGESPLDVQDRLKPALETIMARNLENNILICMHGRAMRILLATILEKDLRAMDEFEHNNLCLYLLTYEQEKFSVVKANDTSHLE